jgi:FKBP-type peptidyl-prolyl cis-trans isomerase (trigger factor)
MTGQTENDLRKRLQGQAEMQLRVDLVLDKLVEVENLKATEAEIDERVAALLADASEEDSGLRDFLEMPSGRHALSHDIERRKAIQRMIAIGDGTAPELADAPAEEAVAAEPEAAEDQEETQGLEIPG